MIFTQNFSFGQYLFFYATGDNIVVGLIHLTTDNEGTPEAYMEDDDVVDNMGDDILEEMEQKNGKICDDYYSSFGKEHEIDNYTYSLYDALEKIL